MEFQKNIFKKLLSIVILIIAGVSFVNANTVLQEITIVNNNLLKVKVYSNKVKQDLIFSFKKSTPNYYIEENNLLNIHGFKIVLKNGTSISKKVALNIPIAHNFEYLEYFIDIKPLTKEHFLPITSQVSTDFILLNLSTILGKLDTDSLYVNSLKIVQDNKIIYNKTFKSLDLTPISICLKCDTFNILKNRVSLKVSYNKNTIISEIDLKKHIQNILENIEMPANIQKELIFLFDTTTQNTGAITHKNSIVFHFNTNDKYIIQKTIIHELYHGFLPNQKNWKNEAFVEYFAIKSMLKSKLISEKIFLEKMSQKIKLSENYFSNNLNEIYNKPALYKGLYSKGVCFAWFLDLKILQKSNFKVDLEKLTLNTFSIEENLLQLLLLEQKEFEEAYIKEDKNIFYNSFLNQLGILYEYKKLKEIKEKQKIKLNDINHALQITDPANFSCLQKGDILYSIDGKRKQNQIIDKLSSLSNKNSLFVIKRNGKKLRYIIDNKKKVIQKISNYLSFIENKTKSQISNWQTYINQNQ